MPLPVMVRFDDDVAVRLRDRAHVERRSVNRVVNDVIRRYLDTVDGAAGGQPLADRDALVEGLGKNIEMLRAALKPLERQETQADYNEKIREALGVVADCLAGLRFALAPECIPSLRESARDEVDA